MLNARALLIVATALGTGGLVGSGVSTLLAARWMPLTYRAPPLPTVAVVRADPSPTPLRIAAPPPPEPRGRVERCDPELELVGVLVDRGRPVRSVAALRTPNGGRAVRLGGVTEGWLLTGVARRRVTLERADARCELGYGRRSPAPSPVAPSVPALAEPRDLRDAITEVEPGRFLVERGLVARLQNAPPPLRAVPYLEGGRVRGVRLYGIRRGSVAASLGLRNGDLLSAIDGAPIDGPGAALEAYARLMAGELVRVTLARRGQPRTLEVQLTD